MQCVSNAVGPSDRGIIEVKLRPEVILIRHAEVKACYKPICYGQLDIPLSDEGYAASLKMAQELVGRIKPSVIFHSGLSRTKALADAIAARVIGLIPVVEDRRLRERDYGEWQGKSWDQIHQTAPELHELVHKPDTYRPPGGETTTEMQRRVVGWFESVSQEFASRRRATVLAISHSGPIAALCGDRLDLPADCWQPWMLKPLEGVRIIPSSKPYTDSVAKYTCLSISKCQ